MVTNTSNDISLGKETVFNVNESPTPKENEIKDLDLLKAPNHSKTALFNLYPNLLFSERVLFKSIRNKSPKGNIEGLLNRFLLSLLFLVSISTFNLFIDEMLSWGTLRFLLVLGDSYIRSPFLSVRNYAQIHGNNISFNTAPFFFVTAAFNNVNFRGYFPYYACHTLIYRSKVLNYFKNIIQIPVEEFLKAVSHPIIPASLNLISNLAFYYVGLKVTISGLAGRAILGNPNHDTYSESLTINHMAKLNLVINSDISFDFRNALVLYFRDILMDISLEFFYYNVTKPLLSGKLSFSKIIAFFKKTTAYLGLSSVSNDLNKPSGILVDDLDNICDSSKYKYLDNKSNARLVVNGFISGVMSATLANIMTQWLIYPFDTVMLNFLYEKVINNGDSYSSYYDCLYSLVSTGGISRLYSGFFHNTVSDFFCFWAFFELVNVSSSLLFRYSWKNIVKQILRK
ncbi:hypothetical protein AYI68_g4459 [Smittium mucronatum]|uniref:Uncharacterized protein n=1 Tax=Smittium mucronatum TaxID=133383 RepID=A0A1R0GX69_9FUNG|nr:hypothetical protein AYI68_g4459 [Smittium mucronatum]